MPGLQNAPQNAQDFIRALKASSDPPQPGGPLKIDIARLAWDDAQLYVPNKSEAIVEWLLSRLLKEKSRARYVLSFLNGCQVSSSVDFDCRTLSCDVRNFSSRLPS